jgi:hypothetical protein
MRDFILSFPTEADAVTALPDYRRDDAWASQIIPHCTRWIQRPVYDIEGEIVTPSESVPGWHCIIRAASLPADAQPYIVTEQTDIEPIPSGGLLVPVVPEEITKLQAKLAIAQLDMVAEFLALRASLDPVADFVKLAFIDDAQVWRRTDPTFNAITDALEKSEAEKDQFFTLAGTL